MAKSASATYNVYVVAWISRRVVFSFNLDILLNIRDIISSTRIYVADYKTFEYFGEN